MTGRLPESLSDVVDPEDLAPELRELEVYWDAKRGARPMPRRADIGPWSDPLELPASLASKAG